MHHILNFVIQLLLFYIHYTIYFHSYINLLIMYTYLNYRPKSNNSYFSASFHSFVILYHRYSAFYSNTYFSYTRRGPRNFRRGGGGSNLPKHFDKQKKTKQTNKQTNKKGVRVWQGLQYLFYTRRVEILFSHWNVSRQKLSEIWPRLVFSPHKKAHLTWLHLAAFKMCCW